MRIHRPLVVVAWFVALTAGVAPAQGPPHAGASVAARSDSVRIGCSGGVTGAGSGNTITRSGDLSAYVKPLGATATHTPLGRDSAAAAAVFREVDRIRFRALRFNMIGNMTCVLELVDSQGEHAVSWVIGQAPPELAPLLAALGRAFGNDHHTWP